MSEKGAFPGWAFLAEEEMNVVDEFVHPDAALVLVHAYAPVAHDVAGAVADEVGELGQLPAERVGGLFWSPFASSVTKSIV